jgi:hypothetical protein
VTTIVQRPARRVDDVVATMTQIERTLPSSDGVWWFNHLYLRVTLGVRAALAGAAVFKDPSFLDRLDVVFGNLYFDALAAGDSDPDRAPPAWRPLLQARHAAHVAPLQFAIAGMNAHINRDLPAAIVAVCEELGGAPAPFGARHDDFERVNGILETVEALVKAEFLTGAIGKVDRLTSPVDDRVAMWNVRAARGAAWTNAQVLWTLKPTPALGDDYFDRLDRFTGFAGCGLLARDPMK